MMRNIIYIFIESYIVTLLLHLAHRSPLLSFHTLWVAIPGSVIVFLLGGIAAIVVYIVNRFYGRKNTLPYFAWGVTVALIGAVLIIGATPIPIGFERYKL